MNIRTPQPPLHPALSRLKDRALLKTLGYVSGRWTAAAPNAADFAVTDPATGMLVACVAALGPTETDSAIVAAEAAFPAWRDRLPQERARMLRRWAELMLAYTEDLALIMTLEQGKPLAESRGEIAYAAEFLDWYAGEATRLNVEGVTPHLSNVEMIVRREALGTYTGPQNGQLVHAESWGDVKYDSRCEIHVAVNRARQVAHISTEGGYCGSVDIAPKKQG